MKRLALAILLCLLPMRVEGVTYYITQSGTGNGLTVDVPDSIADFNADTLNAGMVAGDTVWGLDGLTTGIAPPVSGVNLRGDYPGRECTVNRVWAIGDDFGDDWDEDTANNWADQGGNVWALADCCTAWEYSPGRLWLDGTEYARSDAAGSVDSTERWFHVTATDTLYVYATSDPATLYTTMTGNMSFNCLNIDDKTDITVDGFTFIGGLWYSVNINESDRITVKNCSLGAKSILGLRIYASTADGSEENSYIKIQNNVIDSGYEIIINHDNGISDGIQVSRSCYQCEISGNTVKNWHHAGIYVYGSHDEDDFTNGVSYIDIFNNDVSAPDVDYCKGIEVLGIPDTGATGSMAHHVDVYQNKIHDLPVRCQFGGQNNTFVNNLVWAMRNRSTRASSNYVAQGIELAAWAGLAVMSNNTIAHNTFRDGDEPAITITAADVDVEDNVIANNISVDFGKDSNFDPDAGGALTNSDGFQYLFIDDANIKGNTWQNNNAHKSGVTDVVFNGNEAGDDYTRTISEWNGDTGETDTISGNITADPNFAVPPANWDSLLDAIPMNKAVWHGGSTTPGLTTDGTGYNYLDPNDPPIGAVQGSWTRLEHRR